MTTIIRDPKPLPQPPEKPKKPVAPIKTTNIAQSNEKTEIDGIESGTIRIISTPQTPVYKSKRVDVKQSAELKEAVTKIPKLDSVTSQDRKSKDSGSSANSSPRKSNKAPVDLIITDLNIATKPFNNEDTQKEVANIAANLTKINDKHNNALELFLDNISQPSGVSSRRGSDTPITPKDTPLNTKGANYLFQRWKKRIDSDKELITQEKLLLSIIRKKSS